MKTETGERISRKEFVVRIAIECGMQRFEAEAFYPTLERFLQHVTTKERERMCANLRQIIDAEMLWSYPGGLANRGEK